MDGASRSVRNIQNVYVRNLEAIVEDSSVSHYRVETEIAFLASDVREEGFMAGPRRGGKETGKPARYLCSKGARIGEFT